MKALRLYYDEQGVIIYTIGLEGPGVFPRTTQKEKRDLPIGTRVLTLSDELVIADCLKREGNSIKAGKLILGEVAASAPPLLPKRDLYAEIDELKATQVDIETRMAKLEPVKL